MPLYGAPQAGFNRPPNQGKNLTCVSPGESATLLDGTEVGGPIISVAIARGPSGGQAQAYSTFYARGVAGAVVTLQGSNVDVDADYVDIGTFFDPDSPSVGNSYITDDGSPAFYRVRSSVSGVVVTVQR